MKGEKGWKTVFFISFFFFLYDEKVYISAAFDSRKLWERGFSPGNFHRHRSIYVTHVKVIKY